VQRAVACLTPDGVGIGGKSAMRTLNGFARVQLGKTILRVGFVIITSSLLFFGGRLGVCAQGPDIKFDHISASQGLSENLVISMYQDSKGFMWFGTESGLNRYDGYDFTVYKREVDNPYSLSDNYVLAVYEDSSGVLWVGSWGGLDRFDSEKEQFVHYQHDPDDVHSLGDNQVRAIYEDSAGDLWIGTESGGAQSI
jgi:ligand-binding sensor domain-containing protein